MIETLLLPLTKPTETSEILDSTEQILIKGLINKDAWAFAKLHRMYSANLLGVIVQIVINQETAEDLLQEAFSKIFRNIGRYEAKKGRLFTWMLNICRNTAIDHLRKASTRNAYRTFELEGALPEIDNHFKQSIPTDCIGLQSIIATLPEKQRRVLNLVYFQGYSHVEAAEVMLLPLGSLKTALRLAVVSLRKFFNEAEQKKSA